jgi:hypothetical protein
MAESSAMASMSRAIRLQIQERSSDGKLSGLSDEVLVEYGQIVGALYFDLKDELLRRDQPEEGKEA